MRKIDALHSRDYSEVGVAMILVGEDIGGDIERDTDLGGNRLAERLVRYARVFSAARSNAAEGDVAAIVEVIAQEDFASGGSGQVG